MRDTSKEMYERVKATGYLNNMKLKVYEILCRYNYTDYNDKVEGLTAHELRYYAEMVFHYGNSEHLPKRLSELERMGVIHPVGTRKCRRTGNASISWAITGRMPIKIKTLASTTKESRRQVALDKLRRMWELKDYDDRESEWIELADSIKAI